MRQTRGIEILQSLDLNAVNRILQKICRRLDTLEGVGQHTLRYGKLIRKLPTTASEDGDAVEFSIHDLFHDRLHDLNSVLDHNPPTPAVADNIVTFDANGLPQDSGVAIGAVGAEGGGNIVILPGTHSSIGAGTWAIFISAASFLNGYLHNTSTANLDNISFQQYFPVGTYNLVLYYYRNTDRAILDIDIDGAEIFSVDQYGIAQPNTRATQTGIAIATGGVKTVRLRVDGRNGASANWVVNFQYLAFYRTA